MLMRFFDAFADGSEDSNGGSQKSKGSALKCIVCDQDDHGIEHGIHWIHWCKVKSVVVWTLCSLLHCGLIWALAHVKLPRLPVPWHQLNQIESIGCISQRINESMAPSSP